MTGQDQAENNHTIAAISTPPGVGGVAMVRVSGPDAITICDTLWHGKPLTQVSSHTAHLGWIKHQNHTVDQAVATVYRAPNSFTGQDVVEFSVHGGQWVQQTTLKALLDSGCRMAQAGEFTRRSVIAGKTSLTQAEAIADLIQARSQAQASLALTQLKGGLAQEISLLTDSLLSLASLLELELDFSEEDVEFASRSKLIDLSKVALEKINHLKDTFEQGQAIKEGIPVAIAGAPNVGKSTLLNALLQDSRAIVSNIPGTTRDTVEEIITHNGLQFRLIDTAGLHQSNDEIEKMGIQRSMKAVEKASIILLLFTPDQSPIITQALLNQIQLLKRDNAQIITILNKADLGDAHAQAKISAINPTQARATILNLLASLVTVPPSSQIIITNLRHFQALTQASQALTRVCQSLQATPPIPAEFIAQDLRLAINNLSELTGSITTPDILSHIFSHFCIGK